MRARSRAGQRRAALLAGAVLPLLAVTTLLLRPAPEVLGTVELPAVAAAGPTASPLPLPDGTTVRLTSGGRPRSVLVQGPLTGRPATAVVVVLGPHALSSTRTAQDVRFDELRAQGFAVAYPSTVDGDWNAGRCCGDSVRAGVDDVGFLRDVRQLLERRFALTPRSVGLVGYSTGGQMAYRLLCEDPGYARAAVVVGGSLETSCTPPGRLPATLVVHGMDDTTVPWQVTTRRTMLLDYAPTPALTTLGEYARAGGCGAPVVDRKDGRELLAWPDCSNVRLLSAVGMPGTGHGWVPLGGSVYAARFLPDHVAH